MDVGYVVISSCALLENNPSKGLKHLLNLPMHLFISRSMYHCDDRILEVISS